jgi:F0F1-type ATP synthase assembly protein I
MAKKKPVKKTVKKASKAPAKKSSSRSSSNVTKVKNSSQFKLISIYILLGIIFLGYIFYHSSQTKPVPAVNDYPATEEMSK